VLNTIVAESLDYIATELERGLGARPTPAKRQQVTLALLKKLIREHKRVLFDGDNYSEEWHQEADRRGLPNLRDSVAAFTVMRARKNIDIFRKYNVLSKAEIESRTHIAVEKYVKQVGIEAETLAGIARNLVLPAALRHQTVLAQAVSATKAAGVGAADSQQALQEFVEEVATLRRLTAALEKVAAQHDADPFAHAEHIARTVRPAMAELRGVIDQLETQVAADLWPLPTYRDLLFLK
jgi:glutamine synthetase